MAERPGDEPEDEYSPDNNGGQADEGKILSPHELDITESKHVEQIDEGRFVVSPGARTKPGQNSGNPNVREQKQRGQQPQSQQSQPQSQPQQQSTQPQQPQSKQAVPSEELTEEIVHQWLQHRFQQHNSTYAFDVTARFDGSISQRQMASNDLVTIFESLMLWYAQQVDSSTPVEEILGILLMESNVPVRYPPESVRNLVKSTDLGPDDTIADLLTAVQDENGVQL